MASNLILITTAQRGSQCSAVQAGAPQAMASSLSVLYASACNGMQGAETRQHLLKILRVACSLQPLEADQGFSNSFSSHETLDPAFATLSVLEDQPLAWLKLRLPLLPSLPLVGSPLRMLHHVLH